MGQIPPKPLEKTLTLVKHTCHVGLLEILDFERVHVSTRKYKNCSTPQYSMVLMSTLNADRLLFGDILGEGAFGVVLKAEAEGIVSDRNAKTTVAVKTIRGRPMCLSNA